MEMLKKLQVKHDFYKVVGNPDIQVINPALGRAVYFERVRQGNMYVVSPLQLYLDLKGRGDDVEIPPTLVSCLRQELACIDEVAV